MTISLTFMPFCGFSVDEKNSLSNKDLKSYAEQTNLKHFFEALHSFLFLRKLEIFQDDGRSTDFFFFGFFICYFGGQVLFIYQIPCFSDFLN